MTHPTKQTKSSDLNTNTSIFAKAFEIGGTDLRARRNRAILVFTKKQEQARRLDYIQKIKEACALDSYKGFLAARTLLAKLYKTSL